MKHPKLLSYYTEDKISKILDNNGAFFAFSNKQFKEKKKEGIKYCQLSSGLIAPKENAKSIYEEIEKAHIEAVKQDLKDNSVKSIIFRDCANLELQFSYDGLNEITEYLKQYPISKDTIEKYYKEYIQYCIKNDLY